MSKYKVTRRGAPQSRSDLSLFSRFLGSRAVAVLNQWFQSNRDYPYPDDERTDRLAREAGTGVSQSVSHLETFSFRHHTEASEKMVRQQTRAKSDVLQTFVPFT
jgi:hypothetical protein